MYWTDIFFTLVLFYAILIPMKIVKKGKIKKALYNKAKKLLVASGAKKLVALELDGSLAEDKLLLVKSSQKKQKIEFSSKDTFPYKLLIDRDYKYSINKQRLLAEKYRDKIGERIFRPESVAIDKKKLIKDDLRRLKVISNFPYYGKVLEVGCSEGVVSFKIAAKKKVDKITGIDISPTCIAMARKFMRKYIKEKVSRKIDFKVQAIENLSNQKTSYDIVCAFETLEHIGHGQLAKTLKILVGQLKKNGKFYLSVPNRFPDNKYVESGRARWQWKNHQHFFSKVNLNYILKKYFKKVTFYALYPSENSTNGIYLICKAEKKI
jgi:2-polyprenyl-3-methyl-5-hydroxy-6-metoxy-1,4-benzoquinol methylase